MHESLKPTWKVALLAGLGLSLGLTQATDAGILLADDFADVGDAEKVGNVATIGSWDTVVGMAAPSTSLAFFKGIDGTTAVSFHEATDGELDVNQNMTSGGSPTGGWETTITLAVSGSDLDLTSLVLDMRLTSGNGGDNTTGSKSGQMLVEFFDAGLSSVGSADLGGNQSYPTVEYQRSLDLTGITLSAGQTYTMVVTAEGTGHGHHKSLQALELNGDIVPEPGSLALLGLGGLLIARRRR